MNDPSILDPRVREALDRSGIAYEVLACEPHLADTAEFCAHYGIAPEEACNTIVVVVKGEPRRYVACVVRADTKLDVNHKLSALVGVKRLSFASAEETAQRTGQLIGGVTAFGLPEDMPLYFDRRMLERPTVILGGGNRSSKVRVKPQELAKLPNASFADIAVPRA
ncbi:MAG TPA: YbaK/EbsC family protein [Thermoanaerobaculia bacterium]|nr:YbaK/EbsC family protein [Thermoanaerobaculia bacterium]